MVEILEMDQTKIWRIDKKGFVRILEAAIAIIIILLFIYFITVPTFIRKSESQQEEIYKFELSILEEISETPSLREAVLNEDTTTIDSYVKAKLQEKNLQGAASICEINEVCIAQNLPTQDIYVKETIISTTLEAQSLQPKRIAIYAWTTF
ncbi:MAG: hypothetical protein AABX59_03810 [Nanoarchaeota archaeon]|mgnify:CR=1 FL=1